MLQKFEGNEKINNVIPKELKNELKIWLKCIIDNEHSFPIPFITEEIPVFYVENFSDAAGAAFNSADPCTPIKDERSAAAITLIESKIEACTTVTSTYELICKFPHNSAILEAIGLVMPFIKFLEMFAGKFVKCNVDNISLIFNWEKRSTQKVAITYSLIQTLHLIEVALPCKIFIEHSPRRSSWQTILVDNLSRKETTTTCDKKSLGDCQKKDFVRPPRYVVITPIWTCTVCL